MARNDHKIITVNWFLPPFLTTIQIYPYSPGIVPTTVRILIRTKKGMFNLSLKSRLIVAAIVVNIVMYIPVAEPTAGVISI